MSWWRALFGGKRRFTGDADQYGVSAAAWRAWRGATPLSSTPARVGVYAAPVDVMPPTVGSLLAGRWPDVDILVFPQPPELAPNFASVITEAFDDVSVLLVYGDEDGPDGPTLRTAFDAERFAAQDYVGDAFAVRADTLDGLDRDTPIAEIVGAVAARSGRSSIRHVPRILAHRTAATAAPRKDLPPAALPHPAPKVLVVVPTRDRPDLLRDCAAGVLERTDYPALELCVVDNGSTRPDSIDLLETLNRDKRVRLLGIDAPFNFSALNNAAAKGSDAEVLVFLNDDTVVTEPGWLREMAALAVRPDVGAVGAKLLYPDGRIQHAGVTLGLGRQGVAGHPFRGVPGDMAGPQDMLLVRREVSAVTAACMAVERTKFEAVGGFDTALAVAYNDVDLCLRLADRGWRSLWTPHASLIHIESASRGGAPTAAKAARLANEARLMRDRWGGRLLEDPYYHPALSLKGERWTLAERQRGAKPR